MVETPPKPRRRFLRFSLRGLMLLILLIGVGLGLLVHERQRIGDRRRGLIDAGFVRTSPTEIQSAWCVYLLGNDWPENANDLAGCFKTNDAGLVYLKGLNKVRTLFLDGSRITDAGMVYLAGLTNLRMLDISDTAITDAGLVHLLQLRTLTSLRLGNTQVTDAGVQQLQTALPNCQIER